MKGLNNTQIAEMLEIDRKAVGRYIQAYKDTPEESGFDGVKNWTAKLACEWVSRNFGVRYSINGMLDLFHRLNLSYTRPTYVLAKADPEKQERFKTDFEDLKKTPLS